MLFNNTQFLQLQVFMSCFVEIAGKVISEKPDVKPLHKSENQLAMPPPLEVLQVPSARPKRKRQRLRRAPIREPNQTQRSKLTPLMGSITFSSIQPAGSLMMPPLEKDK